MVKFEESGHEDKGRIDEKPVWYKNLWGLPIVIIFFFILFLLICGVLGKPKWVKIEVSNCYVALVTVGFTYLFLYILRVKSRALKFIFGLLWVLLLPNTAYLFTSLGHIIYQWNNTVSLTGRMILFIEYIPMGLFAIIAFMFSFSPFEIIIKQVNFFQKRKVTWLILFNFLVAFGLVLGRFEHINSYVVLTNPLKVLKLAINILVCFDLLKLTILFGLLCNTIYFLFRSLLLQRIKDYFHIFDY